MHFALDLLDAVASERPEGVLPLVRRAAETGQHLVVRRWLDDQGFNEDASSPEFIEAMMKMTRAADRAGHGAAAGETFTDWAREALANQSMNLARLLERCVPPISRGSDRYETAAKSLLMLGADPLTLAQSGGEETSRAMAGTKSGMTERGITLVAQAMGISSEFAAAFIERSSSPREPWPTVAEVGVAGTYFPVNAAGYALALGDLRALQIAITSSQGDERDMSMALNAAIAFALDSGLVDQCTPEVHHGIAICVARGADLDAGQIGQRLSALKVTLAPEVFGATEARYTLPTLFLSSPDEQAAIRSISRLNRDYGALLNGPASDQPHGATLLHYAVVTDRARLVKSLVEMGADERGIDARGMTAADWAKIMGRKCAHDALTGQDLSSAAPSEWEPDAVPGRGPVRSLPGISATMVAAQNQSSDDGAWDVIEATCSHDEARSVSLEEMEAQSGPPDDSWAQSAQSDGDIDFALPSKEQALPAPAASVDRARVAQSVSAAKASRAATLFENLLSRQAKTATRAEDSTRPREVASVGCDDLSNQESSERTTKVAQGFRRAARP